MPSNKKGVELGEALFTETQAHKNSSWMMPAAVVIFLLIGGAIAAVWVMQTPNTVEANQTNSGQVITATEKPAPEVQNAPVLQPSSFTAPEISRMPVAEATPNVTESPVTKSAAKNKLNPPAPRVEKPEPQTPAKPQPKPKKAVTVDDLIGGN